MIKAATIYRKVLVVDDDRSFTKTLSRLLESRGYQVQVASRGEEIFETLLPDTDLILLDLNRVLLQ